MPRKLFTYVVVVLASFSVGVALGYLIKLPQPHSMEFSEVTDVVYEVARDLEGIRGLKFKSLPEVRVVNVSWVLSHWGPQVVGGWDFWEEIYKLTLIADVDYNLSRSREGLITSWIAASAGNTIYVVSENFFKGGSTAYRVIAHELEHVLQYQYFRIDVEGSLDRVLALRSLIEGDADLVADMYVSMRGLEGTSRITQLPLNDPHISIELLPYIYGEGFVKYLYDLGGWELVNKAFNEPPKSMEQVIHPEKYISGEGPANVTLDVEGVNVIHTDVLGEAYIYVLVARYYNESYAYEVASGWGGDRLVYYVNSTHKAIYWKVVWDSARDADEFYNAYVGIVMRRSGVKVCGDTWVVNGVGVTISKQGNTVLIKSTYITE